MEFYNSGASIPSYLRIMFSIVNIPPHSHKLNQGHRPLHLDFGVLLSDYTVSAEPVQCTGTWGERPQAVYTRLEQEG